MFKRIKNAVTQITSGHIFAEEVFEGDKTILRSQIFSDEEEVMASYIKAPDPKFQYARPHFLCLNADEIQASNNQSSRPVIVPKKIFLMPFKAGYAECTNANKTEVNEDQASAYILPLNSEHPSLQHLTYFGLFDGHDGPIASLLASQNLHLIIKDNIQLVMDELERWMEEKDEKGKNEEKEQNDDGENDSTNNCSEGEKRKKSKKRNKITSDDSDEEDEENVDETDNHENDEKDICLSNDNDNSEKDICLSNDNDNSEKDIFVNCGNDNNINNDESKCDGEDKKAKIDLISVKSNESLNSNKKVTSIEVKNETRKGKDGAIKKDQISDIYGRNSDNIEREIHETKDIKEERDKNSNKLKNDENEGDETEETDDKRHNKKCDNTKISSNIRSVDSSTQTASELLVQSAFCKNCTQAEDTCPTSPPSFDHLIVGALEVSFQQMDDLLLEELEGTKGGCAAIVVVMIAGKIYVANAGDCRAVLYKSNHITQLSTDHTPHNDQHRIRMTAYMGHREELNSDLWTCNKFHKHPYHVDVGSTALYQEPWMNGWFKKVLGREDIKSPLIYGRGKRSRLLQTIGLSRVLGDHNLRLYSSNILLKPLLSSVPQVTMVEMERLFDEEQTTATRKKRQRIKQTLQQTNIDKNENTDILNDTKKDLHTDINKETNKDLTTHVYDNTDNDNPLYKTKKENDIAQQSNLKTQDGIQEFMNSFLNNPNIDSTDAAGVNVGDRTTTTETLIANTTVTIPTTKTASATSITTSTTSITNNTTSPTSNPPNHHIDDATPSFIILASDGLWDTVSNEEAVNCVLKSLSLTPSDNPKRFIIAAQDLVMRARVKSQDDPSTSLNNVSATHLNSTNTTTTTASNNTVDTTATTTTNNTNATTTTRAKTKTVPGTLKSIPSPLKTIIKTDADALEVTVDVTNDNRPQARPLTNEKRGKLQWSTIDDITIFVIPLYADALNF